MIRALVLAVFLVPGVTLADPQVSGTPEELARFLEPGPVTVSFRGEATETAYTDRAIVDVLVTSEARTLAEALRHNQALRDELQRSYREAGIEPDRITSARFSTSPQFGWLGRRTSYVVVNRLSVAVADEAALVAVAASADAHQDVTFGSVRFEHSEAAATENRVRAAAVDDAVARARTYADGLGLGIEPVSFHEDLYESRPSARARLGASLIEEVVATAGAADVSASAQSAAAPASFDEVTYRAGVTVTFEISGPGD